MMADPFCIKYISAISFPENKVQLIALGTGDSLVKQSPGHEEAGLGIFRVPTFIIYKNGKEVWRNLGVIEENELTGKVDEF